MTVNSRAGLPVVSVAGRPACLPRGSPGQRDGGGVCVCLPAIAWSGGGSAANESLFAMRHALVPISAQTFIGER